MDSPANSMTQVDEDADKKGKVGLGKTRLIPDKMFIYDHLPTMDFCQFPELKRLHGAMA
jgi:hypothetical protein